MAITVLAQAANQKLYVRSGTLTSDANGFITLANAFGDDLKDLIAQGCVVVPQISEPSAIQTQFGGALANSPCGFFTEEGNIYRNVANPVGANLADTTDDIMDGFQIPANAFDKSGRGISLTVSGRLAANGNNKRAKIWLNPTMSGQSVNAATGAISGGTVTGAGAGVLLLDSGVQTGNGVGWELGLNFFKYGAPGSNTQKMTGSQLVFGATHGGTTLNLATTQPENAVMNFVITGASPTTGAANDVLLDWTEANAMN